MGEFDSPSRIAEMRVWASGQEPGQVIKRSRVVGVLLGSSLQSVTLEFPRLPGVILEQGHSLRLGKPTVLLRQAGAARENAGGTIILPPTVRIDSRQFQRCFRCPGMVLQVKQG